MKSIEKLTEWRQAEYLTYRNWLDSWDWQWFVTLTLRDYDCFPAAQRMLLDWTRKLCTTERIQVGYFYIYCEKHRHAHMHVLMLGKSSKGKKTLYDVSRSKWERVWPCIAGILIPESNYQVVKYVALHLFKFKCDYALFDFYNRKLLDQCRRSS